MISFISPQSVKKLRISSFEISRGMLVKNIWFFLLLIFNLRLFNNKILAAS